MSAYEPLLMQHVSGIQLHRVIPASSRRTCTHLHSQSAKQTSLCMRAPCFPAAKFHVCAAHIRVQTHKHTCAHTYAHVHTHTCAHIHCKRALQAGGGPAGHARPLQRVLGTGSAAGGAAPRHGGSADAGGAGESALREALLPSWGARTHDEVAPGQLQLCLCWWVGALCGRGGHQCVCARAHFQ